jgi:LysR family transcriptional activator of nhaA
MKWLNYHHLLYFRKIAVEGSVSKAAEKLGMGQPGLSAQLKALEDQVGTPLFDRKGRRLVLTEAGRVALNYAQEIFEKGQEFLQVVENQAFTKRIPVNIGALDSIPKTLITLVVEQAQTWEEAQVCVLEGRGEELFRELSVHQIDLLLSNYAAPVQAKGKLYSRSLARVPVAIYGSPKYSGLRKGFPRSLDQAPMILPTTHSKLRGDIEHFFQVSNLHLSMVAEIQDTSVQKLLAIDGRGLIPLPEFSVQTYIKENKLVKLGVLQGLHEEFWMISAKRVMENPVISGLMRDFQLKPR